MEDENELVVLHMEIHKSHFKCSCRVMEQTTDEPTTKSVVPGHKTTAKLP